jgi:indole-3-glycerol phosphate synthase
MPILDEIARSRSADIGEMELAIHYLKEHQSHSLKVNRTILSKNLAEIPLRRIQVISELKPASPSLGRILSPQECQIDDGCPPLLQPTVNPIDLPLNAMVQGGVAGISILTEPRKFGGSFGNLIAANKLVPSEIPLLLKDFVVHRAQIELGVLCGASNGLIIVKLNHIADRIAEMNEFGMEPLLEVHDQEDVDTIREYKNADFSFVIGVNNRNLSDLSINFDASRILIPQIRDIFGPKQIIITESGIQSRQDMQFMEKIGARAALIGSNLMQSNNITERIQELCGIYRPFVKICGIKLRTMDEKIIHKLQNLVGHPPISAVGVVVDVPKSPRSLSIIEAREIFDNIPVTIKKTLVTKDKSLEELMVMITRLNPDLIQYHGHNQTEILNALSSDLLAKCIVPICVERYNLREAYIKIRQLPEHIFSILLDSSEGQGKSIDPTAAKNIIEMFPDRRFILAGGIGAHNIGEIITGLHPFGVDASSALEVDGMKDSAKIHLFCAKIQQSTQRINSPIQNKIK